MNGDIDRPGPTETSPLLASNGAPKSPESSPRQYSVEPVRGTGSDEEAGTGGSSDAADDALLAGISKATPQIKYVVPAVAIGVSVVLYQQLS
jgi:hypothetical protein